MVVVGATTNPVEYELPGFDTSVPSTASNVSTNVDSVFDPLISTNTDAFGAVPIPRLPPLTNAPALKVCSAVHVFVALRLAPPPPLMPVNPDPSPTKCAAVTVPVTAAFPVTYRASAGVAFPIPTPCAKR